VDRLHKTKGNIWVVDYEGERPTGTGLFVEVYYDKKLKKWVDSLQKLKQLPPEKVGWKKVKWLHKQKKDPNKITFKTEAEAEKFLRQMQSLHTKYSTRYYRREGKIVYRDWRWDDLHKTKPKDNKKPQWWSDIDYGYSDVGVDSATVFRGIYKGFNIVFVASIFIVNSYWFGFWSRNYFCA